MFIDIVPNRKSRPAILLREGWREGKRVRKRTVANLSDWPMERVEALRLLLKGVRMVPAEEAVTVERSLPHGHVEAVLQAIGRLGVDRLVASKRSRQRDLVVAMIAQRLITPRSKLATTRLWRTTSLAEELGVADAQVDELYEALDWLLAHQDRIEKKLARRHLREGGQALYDVSSSYYEGRTCPLARHGHDRDGKKGKTIIVYGVMTDVGGRPVGVEVYPGNTGDPTTVVDQTDKWRTRFGLERVVLVGDRGMLTNTRIEELKKRLGLGWISALRSSAIRQLVDQGTIQLSLFDEQNLAEISSPEYPGERLVVCYNPLLADERRRKRGELLEATQRELIKIERAVARRTRTPLTEAQIALKAGKVVGRYKMAKHFRLEIADGRFVFSREEESIAREVALDGLYVIRTSASREDLTADDTVRSYKNLSHVERAFRTLKGFELRVRPIHLRTEDHVRAHIFLCLLAYYVEWHMRRAWASLLFDDERLAQDRTTRDPVAPARPSASARRKKITLENDEGLEVHSFETLMADLATRCQVRYRLGPKRADPADTEPRKNDPAVTFCRITEPTQLQERAIELLAMLPVDGKAE